jgi:hypothetical protein
MHSAIVYFVGSGPAKLDGSVSKTKRSGISRNSDKSSKTTMTDLDDWRTPLLCYLENTSHIKDRKIQCQALKYIMLDNTLYC